MWPLSFEKQGFGFAPASVKHAFVAGIGSFMVAPDSPECSWEPSKSLAFNSGHSFDRLTVDSSGFRYLQGWILRGLLDSIKE